MALPAQAATLLLEAHSEKNKRPDEALFFLGPQVSEWFVEIYLGWFIFLRTMSGWENPRVWLKKKTTPSMPKLPFLMEQAVTS